MKPIPAVGLSSALVQIIDFGINTLRKDHIIYQSSEPCDAQAHNAAVLQDAIYTLYRLIDVIDASELKKLQAENREQKKGAKLSEAAQQLLKHSEGVKELVEGLRDALIAAQARGTSEDRVWGTLREALMNGTWKKKDVTGAKKKLRALRREIDTSLLLALRQYLDQSAETGLPVFARDDVDGLRHWEKWQNEALDSIHSNEWKPNKKKNVEEFAKIVDGLITLENEAHFCEEIFRALHFEEANERLYAVEAPMQGSMKWVFEDERMNDEGGLLEWLGNIRGDNLFWISGKPGCGKTVLTKYLFRNPQIFDYLEAWSGTAPGITAGFFFWNSGTELQNSPTGMLRSILYEALQDMIYGPLEQDQGIIQWLFAERWNQFTSYGGGLHDFTFAELRKSFELMVADVSKKFLFMVDGLDEMDEYPSELVDVLIAAAKKDNVKVVVSSTARSELEAALKGRPNLVLDEWTKKDSAAHIMHEFGELEVLNKLRRKSDNVEEMNAINTLAEKADGVFLWAKLATAYILHGITEDDNFSAMRSRAWDLPHTLHHLIPKIIESTSTEGAEQLWKVVSLLEHHISASPGLLPLSFALSADIKAALAADARPPKTADTTKRVEENRALLTNTCRSLITAFDVSNPEEPETRGRPQSLKVTYAHRVIRSILVPKPTSENPFDPTTQWSLSYLLTLKSLRPCTPTWPALSLALNTALLRFEQTKKLPATYLDAALSVALTHHAKDPSSADLPGYASPHAAADSTAITSPTSPLDIAVLLNLTSYVALKAKTADKKEVRRALEFSRAVRKRMGRGGEQKWLAGKGREQLREAWGAERSDVEALLEYYGKSVKFGSAKMFVEVPEYE